MSEFENFGGKNKARRLARLVKKGKGDSPKAQKLQAKVQAKVDKLADKGKMDKKRYAFLTDKLKEAGLSGLSTAEQEELITMQDELEEGDIELKSAIDKEVGDENSTWIPKIPNWATITGSILILTGIAWKMGVFKQFKKQK